MDSLDLIATGLVLAYAVLGLVVWGLCRTAKANPADRRPPQ